MFGLGAGEIFLILVFALIFIGPKKLPELAQSLGKSLREFQKAKDDLMAQVHEEANEIKKDVTTQGPTSLTESSSSESMSAQGDQEEEEVFEEFDHADHSDSLIASRQEEHDSVLTEDKTQEDDSEKKDA